MKLHRSFTHALVFAAICAVAGAQTICSTISPDPVAPGQTVTLTVTDISGAGFQFPSSCLFTTVHSGTPAGPVAPWPLGFCGFNAITVAAGASATDTQAVPTNASSGLYYLKVQYKAVGAASYSTSWAPFTVRAAASTSPLLTVTAQPHVGQTMTMDVSSAADAYMPYFAAGSITTEVGISFPPVFVALDPDILFTLSFPTPDPFLFANFQGNLDVLGVATNLSCFIPNIPQIVGLPLHFQVGIIDALGFPKVTNPISTCILP